MHWIEIQVGRRRKKRKTDAKSEDTDKMFGCDCIGKKCGTGDHLKTTPVCPPPSASHPTLKLNKPAFSHQT